MREALGRLLRLYSKTLAKHKYVTQIATGGVLWFTGDLLCQSLVQVHDGIDPTNRLDEEEGGRGAFSSSNRIRIDWERTFRMTLYGVGFSAPAYAFWYSFLERHSQRVFAAQAPGTSLSVPSWLRRLGQHPLMSPLQRFLVAGDSAARLRTWKIIGFKLAMDTFVFDPLYLALFFTATSSMEGRTLNEAMNKLKQSFLTTWLIDVFVWTPIQTANFRFVPVIYQALVVQSCNIGWNAYLSFVQHRDGRHRRWKEREEKEKEDKRKN
jgi:protein Mpv17